MRRSLRPRHARARHALAARTLARLGVGLLGLGLSGCYLWHERIEPPPPPDAAAPDVPPPPPPRGCRVTCDRVERLTEPGQPWIMNLLGTARIGRTLAVLEGEQSVDTPEESDFAHFHLFLFDLDTGAVQRVDVDRSFRDAWFVNRAGLSAEGDAFVVTLLANLSPVGPNVVRAAALDTEGENLWQNLEIAHLPPRPSCVGCIDLPAYFGRPSLSVAADVSGDTLRVTRFAPTPDGRGSTETLTRWADPAPSATVLTGGLLDDDRVVLVAGGHLAAWDGLRTRDTDRFPARLTVQLPSGEAAEVMLPGETFDPPPALATHGAEARVARYVTDPREGARSRIVAQRYSTTGDAVALVQEVDVPVPFGVQPTRIGASRSQARPAFAWTTAEYELHVLPPSDDWDMCEGTIESPPLLTMSGGHGSFEPFAPTILLEEDEDGSLLVVTSNTADVFLRHIEVVRASGCRLEPTH